MLSFAEERLVKQAANLRLVDEEEQALLATKA